MRRTVLRSCQNCVVAWSSLFTPSRWWSPPGFSRLRSSGGCRSTSRDIDRSARADSARVIVGRRIENIGFQVSVFGLTSSE